MATQAKLPRGLLQMVFIGERVSIIEYPASVKVAKEKDMDTVYVSTSNQSTVVNTASEAN